MKYILTILLLMTFACSKATEQTNIAKTNNASSQENQKLESTSNPNEVRVEYAIADEQPSSGDAQWKSLAMNLEKEREMPNIEPQNRVWIRAAVGGNAQWAVYGPLHGDNLLVNIIPIEEEGNTLKAVQFLTERDKDNQMKGLKCCRLPRVTVGRPRRFPRVTVGNPVPDVTVRWDKPIPSITVRGPNVTVEDLPKLPSLDNPIERGGPKPAEVGIFCEVEDGDARLSIQNGESSVIDVWINWKGMVTGPIRVDPKTMRSIGKSGYSSCDTAKTNIQIKKVEFAN